MMAGFLTVGKKYLTGEGKPSLTDSHVKRLAVSHQRLALKNQVFTSSRSNTKRGKVCNPDHPVIIKVTAKSLSLNSGD